MNWYIVKQVFRIKRSDGTVSAYDEQFRLITALTETEAYKKSNSLGMESASTGQVSWEFAGTTDLQKIQKIEDGEEVFYQIREVEDSEDYNNWLQTKCRLLEEKFTVSSLN